MLIEGDHPEPQLVISEAADEDLTALARDPATKDDAAAIDAFLAELDENELLLDRLCRWHYSQTEDPAFECMAIASLQKQGYNMYRLKFWALEWAGRRYRVLYAYDTEYNEYRVLAIVKRSEYDYEANHSITRKIMAEYDAIGIPHIH